MRTRKGGNMRRSARLWGLGAVVALGAVVMLLTTFASAASSRGAKHVRWDIISTTGIPPAAINPGGHASATAPGGDTIRRPGCCATGGGDEATRGCERDRVPIGSRSRSVTAGIYGCRGYLGRADDVPANVLSPARGRG